jgi:hypothetical protein
MELVVGLGLYPPGAAAAGEHVQEVLGRGGGGGGKRWGQQQGIIGRGRFNSFFQQHQVAVSSYQLLGMVNTVIEETAPKALKVS